MSGVFGVVLSAPVGAVVSCVLMPGVVCADQSVGAVSCSACVVMSCVCVSSSAKHGACLALQGGGEVFVGTLHDSHPGAA